MTDFNWQRKKPKPLTDKQRIKALEKLTEQQEDRITELENAAAEHEGWIRKLQLSATELSDRTRMFTRLD